MRMELLPPSLSVHAPAVICAHDVQCYLHTAPCRCSWSQMCASGLQRTPPVDRSCWFAYLRFEPLVALHTARLDIWAIRRSQGRFARLIHVGSVAPPATRRRSTRSPVRPVSKRSAPFSGHEILPVDGHGVARAATRSARWRTSDLLFRSTVPRWSTTWVPPGLLSVLEHPTTEEEQMESDEEIMEILEVFDLT